MCDGGGYYGWMNYRPKCLEDNYFILKEAFLCIYIYIPFMSLNCMAYSVFLFLSLACHDCSLCWSSRMFSGNISTSQST